MAFTTEPNDYEAYGPRTPSQRAQDAANLQQQAFLDEQDRRRREDERAQMAAQRADEAAQRQTHEADIQGMTRTMSHDIAQTQREPSYHVSWDALAPEQKDRLADAYPDMNAGDEWNRQLPTNTGVIPGMGDSVAHAKSMTTDEKGNRNVHYEFDRQNPASSASYDQLDDHLKNIVDQIGTYRLPPPTMRGGYTPEVKAKIMSALNDKYGPDTEAPYDAKEYAGRQSSMIDFKSGAAAKNIKSLNTAIGHVHGMLKSVDALGNTNTAPGIINPIKNAIGGTMSSDKQAQLNDFNSRANAVASELGKVFGGNQPAMQQIHEWRQTLNPNQSPKAQKQSIAAILDLMGSQISSLQDQWQKGVKAERDIPFLNEGNKKIIAEIKKNLGEDAPIGIDETIDDHISPGNGTQQLSAEDQTAIEWAKSNPDDPRSAKILQLHGIK